MEERLTLKRSLSVRVHRCSSKTLDLQLLTSWKKMFAFQNAMFRIWVIADIVVDLEPLWSFFFLLSHHHAIKSHESCVVTLSLPNSDVSHRVVQPSPGVYSRLCHNTRNPALWLWMKVLERLCLPCHSHGLFKVHRGGSDPSVYMHQAVKGKKMAFGSNCACWKSMCSVRLSILVFNFLKRHVREKSGSIMG